MFTILFIYSSHKLTTVRSETLDNTKTQLNEYNKRKNLNHFQVRNTIRTSKAYKGV